jgi:hypothetical protein
MAARAIVDRIGALDPIGLDELLTEAELLTRRDRKYVVPMEVADRLLGRLAGGARVLEIDGLRRFRYESVYFDTPDRVSYLHAARRRPRRFKVRTRAYLDTGRCVLEVKTRDGRGRTVKAQHPHPIERRDRLDGLDLELMAAEPLVADQVGRLRPALTTRYLRTTLALGEAGVRATIDTDLEAEAADGRVASLAGMAIVETKTSGSPSDADRCLWSLGHRPVKLSKFGTSLAALFPELPSNKWTRALGQPWAVRAEAPRAR